MKKDTHNNSGVSKTRADGAARIGEPRSNTNDAPRKLNASGSQPSTVSTQYIDSRMKQFCLR